MNYKGYKLLNEIMLVCRDKKESEDFYFAYLVDPVNKKQLETARRWGEVINYGRYDPQTRTHPDKKVTPAVEFTFENTGFKFSLLDCAGGSSQGGKLSFWNCIVEKDNNKFKIGINSEMLLSLLRDASFVKGVCTEEVCFVTKSGNVGIAIKDSDLYKEAQSDMKLKSDLNKALTSKYNVGDKVSTLTKHCIYLGTVYRQYTFEEPYKWHNYVARPYDLKGVIITKLKEPIPVHLYIDTFYLEGDKLSDELRDYHIDILSSKSRRSISTPNYLSEDDINNYIEKLQTKYTSTFDEERYKKVYSVVEDKSILYKVQCAIDQCRSNFFGVGRLGLPINSELLNLLIEAGVQYVEEE